MMELLLIAGAIALNAVIVFLLAWAAKSVQATYDDGGNVGTEYSINGDNA